MTQVQLNKMVADLVAKALAGQAGSIAKSAPKSSAEKLANKDKSLKATFTKRGFKDVVLLDRTDPTKSFNVKPFKAWVAEGRIVRKGEKSVRGLFHVSQTDAIAPVPASTPVEKPTLTLKA